MVAAEEDECSCDTDEEVFGHSCFLNLILKFGDREVSEVCCVLCAVAAVIIAAIFTPTANAKTSMNLYHIAWCADTCALHEYNELYQSATVPDDKKYQSLTLLVDRCPR